MNGPRSFWPSWLRTWLLILVWHFEQCTSWHSKKSAGKQLQTWDCASETIAGQGQSKHLVVYSDQSSSWSLGEHLMCLGHVYPQACHCNNILDKIRRDSFCKSYFFPCLSAPVACILNSSTLRHIHFFSPNDTLSFESCYSWISTSLWEVRKKSTFYGGWCDVFEKAISEKWKALW